MYTLITNYKNIKILILIDFLTVIIEIYLMKKGVINMLDELKKIFTTFLIYDENLHQIPENYQWFLTDNSEIIGISKTELTNREAAIISSILTPYHITMPIPTEQEKQWKLRVTVGAPDESPEQKFRFIYFSYKKNQIEAHLFKETIQEFYTRPLHILWENDHQGVLIEQLEKKHQMDDGIFYEQIMATLMSDLYVKVTFFVGPYIDTYYRLPENYQALKKLAKTSWNYSEKAITNYVDAVPFSLVQAMTTNQREQISYLILKDFKEDEDFLQTIQTFIQCNLNISVTAKKLYMHRNSLQYRIDKFQEKTGIDIRQFDHAVTVYLALLCNMHKE